MCWGSGGWVCRLQRTFVCGAVGFGAFSLLHRAVIRAMTRRGVPNPVVAAYLKYMRNTEAVLEHGGWRTKGVHPRLELRQGYSSEPPQWSDGRLKTWSLKVARTGARNLAVSG